MTPTKGVGPKDHEQKSDQKVESSDGSHWLFYEMLHLGPAVAESVSTSTALASALRIVFSAAHEEFLEKMSKAYGSWFT